jgi:RNA polymerase sigma-70 factor (ECF subfamily)
VPANVPPIPASIVGDVGSKNPPGTSLELRLPPIIGKCLNKLNLRYNTQMEITERIIIEQLKRGNEEAYKYLYRHHYALLCHIAREYVGDDFLAEMLVGDVIFHLWEVHETLDIQVSLRSYLVRAVRNHCMDYLSSKKERTEVAFSSIPEEGEMRYLLSDDYPLGSLLEH